MVRQGAGQVEIDSNPDPIAHGQVKGTPLDLSIGWFPVGDPLQPGSRVRIVTQFPLASNPFQSLELIQGMLAAQVPGVEGA